MKRLLNKYNLQFKVGLLMVMFYSLHLVTVNALLIDPDDSLSTNSFEDHQSRPESSTDYLLLLAKKDNSVKAFAINTFSIETKVVCYLFPAVHQPLKIAAPLSLRCSEDSYKRYSQLQVFLI